LSYFPEYSKYWYIIAKFISFDRLQGDRATNRGVYKEIKIENTYNHKLNSHTNLETKMESSSSSKHPIFNNEYEIMQSLGEGNTSKVYLAKNINDPKKVVALKLLREEFLQRDSDSIKAVEQEIQILQGLKHESIIQIVGYGSDGKVVKPSGR